MFLISLIRFEFQLIWFENIVIETTMITIRSYQVSDSAVIWININNGGR